MCLPTIFYTILYPARLGGSGFGYGYGFGFGYGFVLGYGRCALLFSPEVAAIWGAHEVILMWLITIIRNLIKVCVCVGGLVCAVCVAVHSNRIYMLKRCKKAKGSNGVIIRHI